MKTPHILIIGGYGNTGALIARLLLQNSDVHITIAGRNETKAKQKAQQWQLTYPNRVEALGIDVAQPEKLKEIFSECDLAVMAAGTIEHLEGVLTVAIETNTDYLDTQLSATEKIKVLQKHQSVFEQRGMTVITDGGFHPGLPAALARYAGTQFDQLKEANVSSYMGIKWHELQLSQNTIEEFVLEFKEYTPTVFRRKTWEKLPLRELNNIKFDFGAPIGWKNCVPMYLHEMETLPEVIPCLEETGFYVAGFNWFTDNIVTPLVMLGLQLNNKWLNYQLGKFFFWSAGTFAKPPFTTVLQMNAAGIREGKEASLSIRITHEDAYLLTAIPVVVCLLQYLEKKHQPGLHFQSHFLEETNLLQKLEILGLKIELFAH